MIIYFTMTMSTIKISQYKNKEKCQLSVDSDVFELLDNLLMYRS